MMNSKIRNLLIVGGVLVILIVAYFLVADWKEKKDRREANLESEKSGEESISLYSTDSANIVKINFTNADCTCNFSYSSETDLWTCDEQPEWTLDTTKIDAILTAVSAIAASKEIDEPDELSAYDLDTPALTVKLDAGENGTYSFMLGAATPAADGYYFMVEGGDKVYVVDTTIMTAFSYNAVQFVAVEEIPAVTSNNIYSMDVAGKDGKIISYYYDGDKTDDSVANNWYITAPFDQTLLGDETNIYQYMSNYASLAYSECVDFAPTDLAQYGLDAPNYTINFKYFDEEEVAIEDTSSEETENTDSESTEDTTKTVYTHKEVTYYIGNAISGMETDEETGEEVEAVQFFYVTSSNTNRVYLFTADVVEALIGVDSFELVNASINANDIMTYDNLTITYNGADYVVSKEMTTEADEDGDEVVSYVYKFNSFKASTTDGESACEALAKLAVSKKITETVEDNTPIAQFKYNGGDGDVTVQFLPYNDNFYRVNKNGGEYFLIEKKDVDKTIESVIALCK